MSLLIATLAIGLVFAVLALGIYMSFRVYQMPDITADGSFPLGAAITARLLRDGADPVTATLAGMAGGALAGAITGTIHVRFKVNALLSGILVMTALYSVNLRIMGASNVPINARTLFTPFEEAARASFGPETSILGRSVPSGDLGLLAASALIAGIATILMVLFLKTELGAAMRATGDNARMLRALGTSTDRMTVLGLADSVGCDRRSDGRHTVPTARCHCHPPWSGCKRPQTSDRAGGACCDRWPRFDQGNGQEARHSCFNLIPSARPSTLEQPTKSARLQA
jgi:putative ABC transport system permease protein